jgi:hypothetical protein
MKGTHYTASRYLVFEMGIPWRDFSNADAADHVITILSDWLKSNPGRQHLLNTLKQLRLLDSSRINIEAALVLSFRQDSDAIVITESSATSSSTGQPSPYSSSTQASPGGESGTLNP